MILRFPWRSVLLMLLDTGKIRPVSPTVRQLTANIGSILAGCLLYVAIFYNKQQSVFATKCVCVRRLYSYM